MRIFVIILLIISMFLIAISYSEEIKNEDQIENIILIKDLQNKIIIQKSLVGYIYKEEIIYNIEFYLDKILNTCISICKLDEKEEECSFCKKELVVSNKIYLQALLNIAKFYEDNSIYRKIILKYKTDKTYSKYVKKAELNLYGE